VNAEDFHLRVHAKAGPDLTYGAVAKAVEEFAQRGRLADRDVGDCIMRTRLRENDSLQATNLKRFSIKSWRPLTRSSGTFVERRLERNRLPFAA
jgi:hypothetical protein